MARRQHLALTIVLALTVFFSISYLFSAPPIPDARSASKLVSLKGDAPIDSDKGFLIDLDAIPVGLLEGDSIAPKLENATLK